MPTSSVIALTAVPCRPGLGEVLDGRLDQRLAALGGGLAGAGRRLGVMA